MQAAKAGATGGLNRSAQPGAANVNISLHRRSPLGEITIFRQKKKQYVLFSLSCINELNEECKKYSLHVGGT